MTPGVPQGVGDEQVGEPGEPEPEGERTPGLGESDQDRVLSPDLFRL